MTFFKQYLRNFWRYKQTSICSIGSLSIAMATTLIIGWWSLHEFSVDQFNQDKDSIYRICRAGYINNESIKIGSCYGKEAAAFKQKFAEIQEVVRVVNQFEAKLQVNQIKGKDVVFAVDSNFFHFFTYDLIRGDKNTCLSSPSSIVISEKAQKKYFPNGNCMGEIITYEGKDWTVTAIMKNVPTNSHLQFDLLVPITGIPRINQEQWGGNDIYKTYIKLAPNTSIPLLEKNMLKVLHQAIPPFREIPIEYKLQALTDIYFDTQYFRFDSVKKGDKRFSFILSFMALAILCIACINFTNLYISTSFLRAKSIAIKKSNGATQLQLIFEFFSETSLYVLLSLVIGLLLAINLLPVFNQLVNSQVTFHLLSPKLYVFLGLIGLITMLLAGAFPAFSLSKLNVVNTLKGKSANKGFSGFQKSLVIIQFAASIVLLITMITIKKQVYFMQHTSLGFDHNNIIYLSTAQDISSHYQSFKQKLEKSPYIAQVSSKSCLPNEWKTGSAVSVPGSSKDPYIMEICKIQADYWNVLKFKIIQGEDISSHDEGKNYVWINESAAQVLMLDEPIGKSITVYDKPMIIKGVLANAKTKSLHSKTDPQIYIPTDTVKSSYPILIKTTGNTPKALKALKKQWLTYNPNLDFEYHFLDQTYYQLYEHEIKSGQMVTWGMMIALLITSTGLVALTHYTTQRRTKEIGIRKANGAKIHELVWMLIKSTLQWVIIGFIIALPIGYYIAHDWLQNFAYTTPLSWWVFALAGVITLAIALLTVSWQSWRAATKNPVEALRYE